jgi:hypothetical protein
MSITNLTRGDQVVRQTITPTAGAMGGTSIALADNGAAIDCFIVTAGSRELRKYAARGSRYLYTVFFSADYNLTVNSVLKWTVRANQTLSPPIYLRVLDYLAEGRPGENVLWTAECEVESTRKESS